MAEESRTKRTSFEDFMFTLLALMLVSNALQRIPVLLEEKLGVSLGASDLSASAALSANTPHGSTVVPLSETPYHAEPGGAQSGTFLPGTALFLSDGPENVNGTRWWYVEDTETGAIGWVPEDTLVREGAGGLDANTRSGARARAIRSIEVWNRPGGNEKVGTLERGEAGVLEAGPTTMRGARWWLFDRSESDDDGWVPEAGLMVGSEQNWRAGNIVRAQNDTDLFERPGGGRTVGTLAEDENARVLGGPVSVGAAYWWLLRAGDGTEGWAAESVLETGGLVGWARGVFAFMVLMGTIVTVGLLLGIMYVAIRTNQVRAKELRRIKEALPKTAQPKRNERWDKVLLHVSSENPNDWRLAIIEADVMLDELITRMGYVGTTLGDRLKQVARGDMKTLDAAWEAHRVRNQVAHAGSDFILTKREARRVIDLYGSVFAEFKFI